MIDWDDDSFRNTAMGAKHTQQEELITARARKAIEQEYLEDNIFPDFLRDRLWKMAQTSPESPFWEIEGRYQELAALALAAYQAAKIKPGI